VRLAIAEALLACASVALISGCKASVEGNVNTGKSEEEIADFDKPMDPNAASGTRGMTGSMPDTALLGARQDLGFNGATTPKCRCLAVSVGQPTDPAFQWAATRPTIDEGTEIVLAFTSAGVSCDAGADAPGASYWGYEVVGQDVIVVVESAKPGRPIAQGGIIPRPAAGGHIYLRPVDASTPYGRPLSGAGQKCQIASLAQPAAVTAAPTAAPASSSGWKTIKTDEADPSSTRVDIP